MVHAMMLETSETIKIAMIKTYGSSRIPTQLRNLLDAGLLDRKVVRLAEKIGGMIYSNNNALVWYVCEEESEWEDDEWI